ncbi:hypothetical protein LJC71_09680 [Desulfosarcina sp. OttesenSCG-928-A07]|nr:hypothetical protein [Desulfosarcina sp. OttesenSCG-928-G17]MDL2329992.1 hypothetical protein [Desulfosarcina sp. OttesenSCG-928-A07]
MSQSSNTQKLVRLLVENPDKAAAFIKDPIKTAKSIGFVLGKSEAQVILDAFRNLKLTGKPSVSHGDFPECHHVEVPAGKLPDVGRTLDGLIKTVNKPTLARPKLTK